ncbi:MAG: alpha/beta fold hydrolase [Alphaproteobacteria bacterium]|nr:MAG: alpha/beta fold hydrolase [Alphaproteobacteria bacterium]
MPLANPVIVIPGITATYLRDEYTVPPEVVWSVTGKEFERSTLHPDDRRYEVKEPARVRADQVFEVAYRELIEELRHNLSPSADKPVPVYPFGYDWRKPLAQIEADLADFVEEVIARTKLMRHYDQDGYAKAPKVNLVGHSMGGLIVAGYMQRTGAACKVGKVASLASPLRGSLEAVLRVATGTANMGGGDASSREREAARLTPALYHLLPSFPGAFDFAPGLPSSIYDRRAWQPGIVSTLTEFVRLHGLRPAQADVQATQLLDSMLDEARRHRERLESFTLPSAGLSVDDWLCVVGANSTTRVHLTIGVNGQGQPEFNLKNNDRRNNWDNADPARRVETGDGTVPYMGALSSFIPLDKIVCVTPDDYGYWEVQDRLLSAASGFHGILPNMDMLHRLIVCHFTSGVAGPRGNIWGRRAPNLSPSIAWNPPIKGLKEAK